LSAGGSVPDAGTLGWKLFIDAHASTSVPSTEKCSSDKQRRYILVRQDRSQKRACDVRVQEPVVVFGEYRRDPNCVVDAKAGNGVSSA
jgi:hypothetical protein